MIYSLFCDRIFDQHVEGEEAMKKERKSLQKMGFRVTYKAYDTWKAAEDAEDARNARS